MEESNSGPAKTNPSSGGDEDLNPGPPDYKSSALPLGHARLPLINNSSNKKKKKYDCFLVKKFKTETAEGDIERYYALLNIKENEFLI